MMKTESNIALPSEATDNAEAICCHHRAVAGHSYSELHELFADLQSQAITSDKRLVGHITTLVGTSWLPRFFRRMLVWVLNLILPWSGKGFFGDGGSNLWFGVKRGPRFGHYGISTQDGVDGKPVIWLDYNTKQNWRILRRIRGEARQLGPSVQLCRMQWKTKKGYFTVMYFTLTHMEQ